MKTQRNRYSADFKARLVLEVLKEQRTLAEIASQYQVHPNLLMQGKKQLLECLPAIQYGLAHAYRVSFCDAKR